MTFDKDIQRDLDDGNAYSLALLAQDMRETLSLVDSRALTAAYRRKDAQQAAKEPAE